MEQSLKKIDFSRYTSILWRRKWWAIIPLFVLIIATVIAALAMERRYAAMATIYIGSTVQEEDADPSVQRLNRERLAEEKIEELRNRMLKYDNFMAIAGVSEDPERRVFFVDGAARGYDVKNSLLDRERFYQEAMKNTQITKQGHTYVQVTYFGQTPDIAEKVVVTLVDLFINEMVGVVKDAYEDTLRRRQQEVNDLSARLNAADEDLRRYRQQHAEELLLRDADHLTKNLEEATFRLGEIEAELQAHRRKSTFLAERLQEITPQRETSVTFRRSVKRVKLDENIAELEVSMLLMSDQFTDDHPRIRRMQAQIDLLRAEREREEDERTDIVIEPNPVYDKLREEKMDVDLEIQMLESERVALTEQRDRLERDIRRIPLILEQEEKYRRTIDALAENYRSALRAQSEAQLKADLARVAQINAFRREFVHKSRRPDLSRMFKVAALGVFFSVGIALAAAVGAELLDQSFATVDDAREFLRIPSLGVVPVISTQQDTRRRRIRLTIILATAIVILAAVVVACTQIEALGEQATKIYGWFAERLDGLF